MHFVTFVLGTTSSIDLLDGSQLLKTAAVVDNAQELAFFLLYGTYLVCTSIFYRNPSKYIL